MANLKDIEVKIPNLGEAEDTEIIEISVKEGDEVSINDPLIVLESEKAAMEVPSDFNGKIKKLNVKEGDSVREGMVFCILESEIFEKTEDKTNVSPEISKNIDIPKQATTQPVSYQGIYCGPAVKKISRELEIDLKQITGTGKNGLITKEDLKNFIHKGISSSSQNYADLDALKEHGDYRLENLSKIKVLGAKNLHASWVSIPHVTHFEEANITSIEESRKKLMNDKEIKITPLAYIIKYITNSLKLFPIFNSSLVEEGKIMIKDYINIGVAVDTGDGLVVPVIKNADTLSVIEIGEKISELSAKAKEKKLMQKDLTGATFSVSSLGQIGGVGFTPIINPPEVGIIGVSRSKKVLSLDDGKLVQEIYLPLSLSYDHRVINGADAGKFMVSLKSESVSPG